ncbi:cytochrome b [Nioella sp. MMSF_3534]|uniref:cytochrome b n=1 Tax=Nioella sp. MMSF_3534 TaxID=3046720 RepID=UPI00273E159C|nr:cytochrome b/b6 domain-containing protein [Nioella sp. MMSF_3534]
MSVYRYHPVTVALHWIVAVLMLLMLGVGTFVLEPMDNADPDKLSMLAIHRLIGLVILGLTVLRIVLRRFLPAPDHAKTGSAFLDKLGQAMPKLLNIFVILMAVSGMVLGRMSGLSDALAGTAPLPDSFFEFSPRVIHGILAKLIMAMLALHILGALYHQIMLRDGLFQRMWFGR